MFLERQILNQKKKDLFNSQMNDLNNFNNHKNQINELKKLDDIKTKKLIDYENENFLNEYKIYQNRLKNMNKNIYRNVNDYNNYFKKINPNIINCNNDYEFNLKIAEEKLENQRLNKFNPVGIEQRIDFMNNLQDEEKNLKEKKLFNQKMYKNYLDNQNKMNKINMLKNNYDYKNNLLLPAYYYPNRPIPIYKKAKDSLLFSKNQSQILNNHNLKKFFEYDSQFNTLIDYENNNNNNTYLGDSNLRHNPITCPVNDYNYNKYINLFKKKCEYIPNNNERSFSIPRVNRNFLSQNFNY